MTRLISRIAAILASVLLTANALAGEHTWRNVKVGGGGYMPGLIFSPVEKELAYLRSDMGGMYRWDSKNQTWLALQDNMQEPNYTGVESVAPDPIDANVVYAAVGTYHAFPAAILRSSDRGDHWDVIPVSFRMGGNEEGRAVGERLAVDPNNTSILYFGSRYDGLQRSTDHGKTWSKVTSFPYSGLGLPAKGERPHTGLSFVIFDPKSGTKGSGSQTIYVGLADPGAHHLYRSVDGGKSWKAIEGEPEAWLLPEQAHLDPQGFLYVTYTDFPGPWGLKDGAVFKYNTVNGVWTNITPEKGNNRPKGGFIGLSIDRQHPGTLVVASSYREGGDVIFHSVDSGDHWQNLRTISKRDVSSVPFLYWGEKEAEFGWWITGLAIDPFDSNHIAYTTGATVYASHELSNADTGKQILWKPWVNGVEQTAVITLVSPPKGAPLISGFGDIGGFVHTDLTKSMPITANPMFTNTNTIDYAEAAPNVIVRSGTRSKHEKPSYSLAYSLDFGTTWSPLKAPLPAGYTEIPDDKLGYNYGDAYIDANIIVSSDGKSFVVMTPEPVVTKDRGKSWIKVSGLPAHHGWIVADSVRANTFYALDFEKSRLYISEDGAHHFDAVPTKCLPSDIAKDEPKNREDWQPLLATPNRAGELWFVSRGQLYHSVDGGKNFSATAKDMTISVMDFGKAAPGKDFLSIYAIAQKGGLTAIWQSLDNGTTWTRINDDRHEFFRAYRRIAADKNVFGRVYVATDGRGIVIGEPAQ